MKIQVKINGKFVGIDLDKCAIKSVSKDKYQSVDLCVESVPNGVLIPFAQIKLYDDDMDKAIDDAMLAKVCVEK